MTDSVCINVLVCVPSLFLLVFELYLVQAIVTVTMPKDARIFQMWGHLHIAGYNLTLYEGDSTSAKPICTSYPFYGTEPNQVGNEKGYVVKMTKCEFDDKPFVLRKGEKYTLQA